MNFERIHITGASGTGTSTLGHALALLLDYDWFDADDYFWEPSDPPFQKKRAKDERFGLLWDDLLFNSPKGFILSGSICGWGESTTEGPCFFDLIVFLDLPTPLRLARLREREIARFGRVNPEFLDWAARYDEGGMEMRSRALHEAWLARQHDTTVLRLEGDLTVEERVAAILLASPKHSPPKP